MSRQLGRPSAAARRREGISIGLQEHRAGRFAVRLASGCLAILTGCSLVFGSRTQDLKVASDPNGAQVWVNGELRGTTPLTCRIRRWNAARIEIRKEGYEPVSRGTARTLSGLGITDAILGGFVLFPYFGLLSGGAWEQTPSDIYAILLSMPETSPPGAR